MSLEAFKAMTEEQIEAALEKAWGENGQCGSCGWHSAFYEVKYDLWPESSENVDEWYTWCHSKDRDDDDYGHRGCTIYPKFEVIHANDVDPS